MADKAYITPNVLKWARESARMSIDIAAAKVSVKATKLQEWEEGVSQPTIKQAETLAKAYRRPFALFFLPEIPRDFLPLQDFRRQSSKELSTGSIFIIREIQQKQTWISEINQESNELPLGFVGKFDLRNDPREVAEDITKTLGIKPSVYGTNPIKTWIEKAEENGIFISRSSFIHSRLTLDSDEIQGFAIADPFAPFIFVNSDDWNAAQLFTLVHELAHIWIAESGISNDIEVEDRDKSHPIEIFCNEVAANALMPTEFMNSLHQSVFKSSKTVFRISRALGVSSFAFLVRALNLRKILYSTYRRLKAEADEEFKTFLLKEEEKASKQKQSTGGPNYYLLCLNKNSRLFTQIVLDAFKGGRIPPTEASSLLNMQTNKFHKLESLLH